MGYQKSKWQHRIFAAISYFSLAAVLSTPSVFASVLRVPKNYPTIQSAIDASVDGDTVLINDGTYTGDGNRDIDFHGKAIVVTSVTGAENTIIDCQADSLDPHRGFIFHSGEDSLAVLQGLTIQNGFAPGNVDSAQSNGGGILCDSSSSPVITECVITQNWALNAGGGVAILNSSPTLTKSVISSNLALNFSYRVIRGLGGGIYCTQSNPALSICTIDSNVSNVGGGVASKNSNIWLDSSKIRNNISELFGGFDPVGAGIGGGIYLFQGAPILTNCEVTGNSAQTLNGGLLDDGKGGGIYCYMTNPLISTCTIANNIAEGWPGFFSGTGGGLYCHTANVTLERCIIANNFQAESIYLHTSATISISCTDIFGNEFGDWLPSFDSLKNKNSNFSADAQFCDPITGDFQISQSSPCLEGQSLCGERVGMYGIGCVTTNVGVKPETKLPESFILHQNYPNPFNAATTIRFESPTVLLFKLVIYNILGETVHLIMGTAVRGLNTIVWNAKDIASGIYYYSLKLDTYEQTRKMLLLK